MCIPQCGDGKRAGSETWDDGGVTNGDGCSSTWTIESGYIWVGGTTSTRDTCSACTAGLYPDAVKSSCVPTCGDGKRAGSEACDDGGVTNDDGCSSTWIIEDGYVWSGGSITTRTEINIRDTGIERWWF